MLDPYIAEQLVGLPE